MARFMVSMIPKVMGDMPRFSTMGRRMGERMMVAGILSMRQPTHSSRKLISSSKMILLSVTLSMPSAMRVGMRSIVK